jgi:tRNA(Met) C34 N-acetyltransferase TmcA
MGEESPYTYSEVIRNGGGTRKPDGYLVSATHTESGEKVGHLLADHSGRIQSIAVTPAHQRRGVATGMWEHAQNLHRQGLVPAPRHSKDRSDQGDAWAKSVGGRRPRRVEFFN